MNNLRIIELFGGIGACTQALKQLNILIEVVDYVEIDKYAVASYNAINGTNFEPQDITTWDKDLKDIDLIMHGSPCQDFSIAGKQAGGDANSGTRSSLMYETIRIVSKIKPKYVIWENVKNLLSKKHKHNFDAYLQTMEELGYKNYYQVLNAKDYGIPQNRERVFTVSILGNEKYEFPKGIKTSNRIIEHNTNAKHQQDLIQDENGLCRCIPAGTHGSTPHLLKTVVRDFKFPPKQELKLRLKDLLEDEVNEKYYLSQKMIEGFLKHNENHDTKGTGFIWKPKTGDEIANCLRANAALCPTDNTIKCIQVGTLDIKGHDCLKRVYSDEGLSPTLTTMGGGNTEPKVVVDNNIKPSVAKNYVREAEQIANSDKEIYQCECDSGWQDNKVGIKVSPTIRYSSNHTCVYSDYRIRKLTPKECWRLMGFSDTAFEKAEKVNSNTQLYKQAGNSIVVNVLTEIFKKLFAH